MYSDAPTTCEPCSISGSSVKRTNERNSSPFDARPTHKFRLDLSYASFRFSLIFMSHISFMFCAVWVMGSITTGYTLDASLSHVLSAATVSMLSSDVTAVICISTAPLVSPAASYINGASSLYTSSPLSLLTSIMLPSSPACMLSPAWFILKDISVSAALTLFSTIFSLTVSPLSSYFKSTSGSMLSYSPADTAFSTVIRSLLYFSISSSAACALNACASVSVFSAVATLFSSSATLKPLFLISSDALNSLSPLDFLLFIPHDISKSPLSMLTNSSAWLSAPNCTFMSDALFSYTVSPSSFSVFTRLLSISAQLPSSVW